MSYELSQCIAPLPPVERGKSVIIGGDPKGKNFLYCSGKGIMNHGNSLWNCIFLQAPILVSLNGYKPR